MRIAAVVIICLAAAGLSGCAQDTECATSDSGAGGASGPYQTAQQALDALLAQHVQWLSLTGWVVAERSANGVTFTSGNDEVDVLKAKDGRLFVAGTTACN